MVGKGNIVPDRSLPMIPEMIFASSTDNPNPFGYNTILDEDGLSSLLICEDCKVCVHSSESSRFFFFKPFTTRSVVLTTLKKEAFKNIMGKGENAGNHFALFYNVF